MNFRLCVRLFSMFLICWGAVSMVDTGQRALRHALQPSLMRMQR